jgi:hypothetical protein
MTTIMDATTADILLRLTAIETYIKELKTKSSKPSATVRTAANKTVIAPSPLVATHNLAAFVGEKTPKKTWFLNVWQHCAEYKQFIYNKILEENPNFKADFEKSLQENKKAVLTDAASIDSAEREVMYKHMTCDTFKSSPAAKQTSADWDSVKPKKEATAVATDTAEPEAEILAEVPAVVPVAKPKAKKTTVAPIATTAVNTTASTVGTQPAADILSLIKPAPKTKVTKVAKKTTVPPVINQ